MGRFLDDVQGGKAIHRFAELTVAETAPVDLFRHGAEPAQVAVRPYYTTDNDLSVVVNELA